MNPIISASPAVSAIGLLCAAILAIASKIMHVPVDERTEKLREILPGANCGACGYPGCDGYAAALTGGGAVATNLCIPGGDSTSRGISNILGVEFEDVIEAVAFVKCGGKSGATQSKAEYSGIKTCAAVGLFFGGQGACAYGCLGYGDCAAVCPEGAITLSEGLAYVNKELCHGCGMCARTCPKNIIEVVPTTAKTIVKCGSLDNAAQTRAACSVGCLSCGKCVKICPEQAITVSSNLALIDNEKCTGCGKCLEECIAKCILRLK